MSEPTVAEIARAVARELEDESRWSRGFDWARNENGEPCAYNNPGACRWCADGHAARLFGVGNAYRLIAEYRDRFGASLGIDNDDKGREHVRDRLLELPEAQP